MLDTESLLRLIREDAPAGENLRDDPSPTSPYYQIKDARNAARSVERAAQMAEDPSSAPNPDWQPVLELAPRLLTEVSKDLEIAVWWIEALVRKHGFAGLSEGFEVVRRMLQEFWDGLHPLPDEEGIATRVAPLTGLNGDEAEGTLIVPIAMVPLLRDDHGPLGTWHYRSALEVAAIPDLEARERRIEAGAVPMERIQAAVAACDPAELFQRMDEVGACIEEFDRLSSFLDERCGSASPPTSNIRQALEDVRDCMRYLTKDLPRPLTGGGEEATGAASAGAPVAQPQGVPGEVHTRQDAVEAMRRVRDYFRRTEPHSPIPYVIDQALRWAQMPLHLLAAELISDPAALESFQLRTGMGSSSSEEPTNEE